MLLVHPVFRRPRDTAQRAAGADDTILGVAPEDLFELWRPARAGHEMDLRTAGPRDDAIELPCERGRVLVRRGVPRSGVEATGLWPRYGVLSQPDDGSPGTEVRGAEKDQPMDLGTATGVSEDAGREARETVREEVERWRGRAELLLQMGAKGGEKPLDGQRAGPGAAGNARGEKKSPVAHRPAKAVPAVPVAPHRRDREDGQGKLDEKLLAGRGVRQDCRQHRVARLEAQALHDVRRQRRDARLVDQRVGPRRRHPHREASVPVDLPAGHASSAGVPHFHRPAVHRDDPIARRPGEAHRAANHVRGGGLDRHPTGGCRADVHAAQSPNGVLEVPRGDVRVEEARRRDHSREGPFIPEDGVRFVGGRRLPVEAYRPSGPSGLRRAAEPGDRRQVDARHLDGALREGLRPRARRVDDLHAERASPLVELESSRVPWQEALRLPVDHDLEGVVAIAESPGDDHPRRPRELKTVEIDDRQGTDRDATALRAQRRIAVSLDEVLVEPRRWTRVDEAQQVSRERAGDGTVAPEDDDPFEDPGHVPAELDAPSGKEPAGEVAGRPGGAARQHLVDDARPGGGPDRLAGGSEDESTPEVAAAVGETAHRLTEAGVPLVLKELGPPGRTLGVQALEKGLRLEGVRAVRQVGASEVDVLARGADEDLGAAVAVDVRHEGHGRARRRAEGPSEERDSRRWKRAPRGVADFRASRDQGDGAPADGIAARFAGGPHEDVG